MDILKRDCCEECDSNVESQDDSNAAHFRNEGPVRFVEILPYQTRAFEGPD